MIHTKLICLHYTVSCTSAQYLQRVSFY